MNRSKKLTQDAVDAARPRRKEYLLSDDRVRGLSLRVRPTGSKTWLYRWFDGERMRKASLGQAKDVPLDEARRRAADPLAARFGPDDEAAREAAGPKLSDAAERFLKEKEAGGLRTHSYRVYVRSQLLPHFGDIPIGALTTPRIANWFHRYSTTRPGGANESLKLLSAILRYARDRALIPPTSPDPCAPIEPNPRRNVGRILGAEGLARLGRALNRVEERDEDAADAIRLILLTGCRSGEIRRLSWREAKFDRLKLETGKTGPRDVLLSSSARRLLRRRRKFRLGPYVFPSPRDRNEPLRDLQPAWRRVKAATKIDMKLRLHDLRHSYASHAVMSGETLAVTGRLLGHRRPVSTERYAHYDGVHLSAAAERVCARVAAAMG